MNEGKVIELKFVWRGGTKTDRVAVSHLIIAGWTGRDKEAMERHIRELENLGVSRPAATPMFYRVSGSRLTTSHCIQVCGPHSSGEVEFVIINLNGEKWVGVGSDHTDRELEKHGVAVAKQICDKPVASTFWSLSEVEDRWDSLRLRSYVVGEMGRELYQDGTVALILTPQELMHRFSAETGNELPDGGMMFCGTLPAIGGVRGAARFEFELSDPVSGRAIAHGYDIVELPVVG